MCGLAGFIDFNKKYGESILVNMTDVLEHRGPDDKGYRVWESPAATIGFGHRRLSIIDLSPLGHQPMSYQHDRFSLIYNGEIYNYREVQAELIAIGYKFISQSDSEVILAAYTQWGNEAVHKFIGMFVIVIYDTVEQTVTVFRDRAGVKPLYYFQDNGLVLFASELKSFHAAPDFSKEIDPDAVRLYLKYGYIPQPYSIFNNTSKLRAGHYLVINLASRETKEIKYWDVADYYLKPKLKLDETEALEETEKLLISACEYRMVSDVPVGIFLSGGYDSTLVAALLQKNRTEKLRTFTIGFHDKKFNEANEAKITAEYLGTEHSELYCDLDEARDIIPVLAEYYDEPFGDTSAIPTILVSRFARTKVTVALSADAGDEVFAGYTKYTHMLRLARLNKLFNNKAALSMLKTAGNLSGANRHRMHKAAAIFGSSGIAEKNKILSAHFSAEELDSLLAKESDEPRTNFDDAGAGENPNITDALTQIDYKTYLPDDILVKTDRASMSVGLESREPLIDHRVAEWMAQMPAEFKIKNGIKKYLLKEIVHKYVPSTMMDRPKKGFGIPVYDWLRNDLKYLSDDLLSQKELNTHGLFNDNEVAKVVRHFLSGTQGYDIKFWLLLNFQLWYKRWIESTPEIKPASK